MNPLFASALELQRFMQTRSWRFCFIGGPAVQRWGEPRLTLAIDCTLITGFGEEPSYIDELLEAFDGRLAEAREFALANRVLLLRGPSNVPVDIALGAMPFEERCVERGPDLARADASPATEGGRRHRNPIAPHPGRTRPAGFFLIPQSR